VNKRRASIIAFRGFGLFLTSIGLTILLIENTDIVKILNENIDIVNVNNDLPYFLTGEYSILFCSVGLFIFFISILFKDSKTPDEKTSTKELIRKKKHSDILSLVTFVFGCITALTTVLSLVHGLAMIFLFSEFVEGRNYIFLSLLAGIISSFLFKLSYRFESDGSDMKENKLEK